MQTSALAAFPGNQIELVAGIDLEDRRRPKLAHARAHRGRQNLGAADQEAGPDPASVLGIEPLAQVQERVGEAAHDVRLERHQLIQMRFGRFPDVQRQAMLEPEPPQRATEHLAVAGARLPLADEQGMPITDQLAELAQGPQLEQVRKPLLEPGPPHLERFAGGAAGAGCEQPRRVIAARQGRTGRRGTQVPLGDDRDPAKVGDAPDLSRPDAVALEQLAVEGDVLIGVGDDRPQPLVLERFDPCPPRPPVRAKRLRDPRRPANCAWYAHARSA